MFDIGVVSGLQTDQIDELMVSLNQKEADID